MLARHRERLPALEDASLRPVWADDANVAEAQDALIDGWPLVATRGIAAELGYDGTPEARLICIRSYYSVGEFPSRLSG